MCISLEWADPAHNVLHITHKDPWSMDDLRETLAALSHRLTDAPDPSTVIVDIRGSTLPPDMPDALPRVAVHPPIATQHNSRLIIVGGSVITANLYRLAYFGPMRRTPNFHHVHSMDEALRLL